MMDIPIRGYTDHIKQQNLKSRGVGSCHQIFESINKQSRTGHWGDTFVMKWCVLPYLEILHRALLLLLCSTG